LGADGRHLRRGARTPGLEASTVEETEFPEPGNRAIGGGGVAAGAVPTGDDGELAEGETVTEEAAGPGDIPEDEVEYFEVEFGKEGETIEVANDQPLLDQGEDAGMDLPYACRQGQCVSCAGQITSGGNARSTSNTTTNRCWVTRSWTTATR